VIGSSFAGIPVALRAAEAGWSVLVVEAGAVPGAGDGGIAASFEFRNAGEVVYPLPAARLIALGGASNHWTGTVNRLLPEDLALRTRYGRDVDWPLDYRELERFYCAAESWLAVDGFAPLPGAEPPRACAYPSLRASDYRAPELAVGGISANYYGLARSARGEGPVRLIERELPRFAALPNAALLQRHPVRRLVSRDGKRIDHALAVAPDGREVELRGAVFLLAAGVVESARLLLLSASAAHPKGLGNAGDQVGRHLCWHPTERWGFRPPDMDRFRYMNATRGEHRSYAWLESFRSRGLCGAHFQLRLDKREVVLKFQPEIEARPENRVALAADTHDPRGDAIPELRLALSERDRRTQQAGRELLAAQARSLGLDPSTAERSEKFRYHPSGTLRMARDEQSGVVDSDLRVFGVENLYASGASVFPAAGTANPTLTIVALALRLAEQLLARGRERVG
jgi:choline dehydrogenase-like flavoprotein